MILILMSSLGFVAQGKIKQRWHKVILGIVSFLIFTGGMGLIARLGFGHGQGFPLWVNIKIAMWFLVNIIFIMIGRSSLNYRKWLNILAIVLVLTAVIAAVFKPIL